MIDCSNQQIPYVNVPVPAFTFPFFSLFFRFFWLYWLFFLSPFLNFRYLPIFRFSYFVHDSVAAILFLFSFFSFDYYSWLVASTGSFFDPFIPDGYPLDFKSVNCLSFTVSWTGPENLYVYCTRFFMFFLPAWGRRPLAQPPGRFFLFFYPVTGFFSKEKSFLPVHNCLIPILLIH